MKLPSQHDEALERMKTFLTIPGIIATLVSFMGNTASAAETLTHAPACIELHDQFNALQKMSFPAGKVTLLTIADKKGSKEISGWVAPVKQHFDTRVDIRGIADMSGVPVLLRGVARKQFRETQHYPVMLDWTGDVVKSFGYTPGKADVLLLDCDGKILYRTGGKADDRSVRELRDAIERALSAQTTSPSAK